MSEAGNGAGTNGIQQIAPQGVGGYHQCWYPLATSDEVKPGQVIGREFCDGRVVIYRGESGKASILGAYCRHLGTDLQTGEVIGDDLRCAFHHWKYDADGKCLDIPSGDPIPADACMFKFPTAEALGLIWAFNGEEALYDPPSFPQPESELAINVLDQWDIPTDHWVGFTNSYDFSHLQVVNGIDVLNKPDDVKFSPHGAKYRTHFVDPNLGPMELDHELIGTNFFYLSGNLMGMQIAIAAAMAPVPGNKSRGWSITAAPKGDGGAEAREASAKALAIGANFIDELLKDDAPIFDTIRFKGDNMLSSDLPMKRFLDYIRNYPRAHPSQPFLT